MARRKIPKGVKKRIDEYLQILKKDKLPIKEVILFGSYAKGTQHKWSDVDLCVVSPKFINTWQALQYLSLKTAFDMKYTIEPIGFSPRDFNDKYSSIIHEIKAHGIKIPIKK